MAALVEPTVLKMCRKKFRAQLKKLRRKRIRQALAKSRQENAESGNEDSDGDEPASYAKAERLAEEELIKEKEERLRERLHCEWLQRETVAQLEFQRRKVREENARKEREEKEKQIREEWEALQKKEEDRCKRLEAEAEAKKEREATLLREATQNIEQGKDPWCNPTAPADYGSELDKHNCPFFLKTGACRFGERCSRAHPRLPVSRTILIPGMFLHFGLDKSHRDEFDSDMGLEYDDSECNAHFREFSDDVLPEFKSVGKVVQFKVCRNLEPHLRGNVYVQFEKEEEALAAYQMFNGRYYAGKQLSCEFTSIAKWKSAICGLYLQNRCPKGRNCNFLHVFSSPNDEFFDADRDLSPAKDTYRSRRSRGGYSWRDSFRSSSRRSRTPSGSRRRRRSSSRDTDYRSSRTSSSSRRWRRQSSSHDRRSPRVTSSSRRRRSRSKTSSDGRKKQRRRSRSSSWEEVSNVQEQRESRRSSSSDWRKDAEGSEKPEKRKASSETKVRNGNNHDDKDHFPRSKRAKRSKHKHKKSSSKKKHSSTSDNS